MSPKIRIATITGAALIALSAVVTGGYLLTAGADDEPGAAPPATKTCVSTKGGYAVDYPSGWFTTQLDASGRCVLFDRERFTLEPNSEYPLVDLEVIVGKQRYGQAVKVMTERETYRVVSKEDVEVAGLEGIKLETKVVDGAMVEAGTTIYRYILDHDGQAVLISTFLTPGTSAADAAELRAAVDAAAASLTFSA